MIRLLLLAAAGLVGYRLAREYIDDVPAAAPRSPARAGNANARQKSRKH